MSQYTTGEIAKLCSVTVRTVQYYDSRKILVPSELSEGGRRLYSEDDLKKLKIICFLKSLGLSLNNIRNILSEKDSDNVIRVLLEEQAKLLKSEIAQRESTLHTLEQLVREMKSWSLYSVETIHDIASTMENRKKLRNVHMIMLFAGVLMNVIQIAALFWGIVKGIWLPFFVGIPFVTLLGVFATRLYYRKTAYICPQCHTVFQPGVREFIFSAHTPKTRKLFCKTCGRKGYCVETYRKTGEAAKQR